MGDRAGRRPLSRVRGTRTPLGLLQSVPRLDGRAAPREACVPIEGSARDMLNRRAPARSSRAARYEVDLSRQEVRRSFEILAPYHWVACFNPVPADEMGKLEHGNLVELRRPAGLVSVRSASSSDRPRSATFAPSTASA